MPRRNQQTAAPVEQPAEEARETQRQDPPRLLRNMLHNPRRRTPPARPMNPLLPLLSWVGES